MIGNTIVYENKDDCHGEAIKNYTSSIEILERNLTRHYKDQGVTMPKYEVNFVFIILKIFQNL